MSVVFFVAAYAVALKTQRWTWPCVGHNGRHTIRWWEAVYIGMVMDALLILAKLFIPCR